MAVKISDEQIKWYSKQDYTKQEEKTVDPAAILSAGAIVLNKEAAALFADGDSVIIGTAKRGGKKVLLRPAQSGDPYTPFRAQRNAKGALSIKCRSFVQDVLVGEYGLDLSERKRARLGVQIDSEHNRVVLLLK